MGVLVQDSLQLDSGLSINNTYATFGTAPLTTTVSVAADGTKNYTASGVMSYYLNQDGYASGNLQPLYRTQVEVPLDGNSVQAICGIMYGGFAAQNANVQIVD